METPPSIEWQVTPASAMRAHFMQPSGPSKPGADWAVRVVGGTFSDTLMVRIYPNPAQPLSDEQEARAVAEYLLQLLASGWSPQQYEFKPGFLTVGLAPGAGTYIPASSTSASTEKPWWKFW